jgi:hypothetical protein
MELSRTGIDSGGMTPSDKAEVGGSMREARLLETRLLVGSILEDLANFEDCYEELAVHYSVDVPMSGVFVEWLCKLGGRAREVLKVLGLEGDEEDKELFSWSTTEKTILSPTIQNLKSQETPNKKVQQQCDAQYN